MVTQVKKFNLSGEEIGVHGVSDYWFKINVNSQLVKDYIIALRANARRWTANTKGRSEVNHSTKKPHAQKGGGRSRQGSLAAPQYKGGGRVFGPKPKFDQCVSRNKTEKRLALSSLVSDKIKNQNIYIIEDTVLDEPKTKKINSFLKKVTKGKRVLFLGEGLFEIRDGVKVSLASNKHKNMILSCRNIPGVSFELAQNINGYDLMVANDIVITEKALVELEEWLLQGVKE